MLAAVRISKQRPHLTPVHSHMQMAARNRHICMPGRIPHLSQRPTSCYTGGNMERPALRRLFADIEAGKIDCVLVYKVYRLSRSLLDFARMMEIFERHNVSFVSVTHQFNTAASMGRFIVNVLLSFAPFEREIISERTRDKIAATRRKGNWSGGMPLLGYDVVDTKLVVLPSQADQIRQIFELYLEKESLIATAEELNRRGVTTKTWATKKGVVRGGLEFGKTKLHQLLTNVTYLGKIRCIGRDPALVAATVAETRRQTDEAIQRLKRERAALESQRRVDAASIGGPAAVNGPGSAKRAAIDDRTGADVRRLADIREEIGQLTANVPSADAVAAALADFDATWESLTPREPATALGLLIGRVDYDAGAGNVAITFHMTGLKALEAPKLEETAA